MQNSRVLAFLRSPQGMIAVATLLAVACSLVLSAVRAPAPWPQVPLWAAVAVGGTYLVWHIVRALARRTGGADVLAAISIVAAVIMGEWMVAAIIVLMLAGGEGLEAAATSRASQVLDALARRAPTMAHLVTDSGLRDVEVDRIEVGDTLVVLPHELCPVDGEVVEGHGAMDESYLTGEPYVLTKSVGSAVMSGAVNGVDALTIRATKVAADSRYAQVVGVLTQAENDRPPMRRLADRLGGWYTAGALVVAGAAWALSGDPSRFLAVVVVATPCPLLIGVPVAIIGAISLSARSGIIIKDPGVLERLATARTMMFDKTGTLTYGRAVVAEILPGPGQDAEDVLQAAAALERYSRHPLASAVVRAAEERASRAPAADRASSTDAASSAGASASPGSAPRISQISERPGEGLAGQVDGREVRILAPARAAQALGPGVLPDQVAGMECVVLLDGVYGATLRFRDEPRPGAREYIEHLRPRHGVLRTVMISGDRSSEVAHVAEQVGIQEVYAGCSPERKLQIVTEAEAQGPTAFLGDGINDAPAMAAAGCGIAFGANSDVTSEAADAVVLDSSLDRLDELVHISERLRRIALQTALGGIGLSILVMVPAALGLLAPVFGALAQEAIDLLAVLNAARVAVRRAPMADYETYPLPPSAGSAGTGSEPASDTVSHQPAA